jgi:hypothetical protein
VHLTSTTTMASSRWKVNVDASADGGKKRLREQAPTRSAAMKNWTR